jgi:NhaP-type Na+/H+ or K+/H+ antiporter
MIASRILLIFPGAYLPRWIERRLGRPTTPYPPWRYLLFGGWAGIRGGDSLVIALALPYRDSIIFITFVVILITLVAQGLTLAPLIRLLGIVGGNEEDAEERHARRVSLRAGADALQRFVSDDAGEVASAAELRQITANKLGNPDGSDSATSSLRPRLVMLAAARDAIIGLRDRGEIGDAVMRRLQSELDHEEILLRQRRG